MGGLIESLSFSCVSGEETCSRTWAKVRFQKPVVRLHFTATQVYLKMKTDIFGPVIVYSAKDN